MEDIFVLFSYGLGNFTHGCGDSVAFGVQQATNLGEVAVPLHSVIQHGGLHEEGVVSLEHPANALLVRRHKHRRLFVLHEPPHLFVCLYHRVLTTRNQHRKTPSLTTAS
jgi:hypothetical protein